MNGFRKSSNINEILAEYLRINPNSKWKGDNGFHKIASKDELTEIYNAIHYDQGGICAYCEILLKWPDTDFTNDFRVEHFHPEDEGLNGNHNYSLDWNNLLGCCHGGSSATSRSYGKAYVGKKYHSCDVPKGNKILDDIILNPLVDLPPNTTFFDYKEDGSVLVGTKCPDNMKQKAQATIKELNLDCLRLRGFREGIIEELADNIEAAEIIDENELEKKILQLRDDLLSSDLKPEFYSTIDWYLVP